VKMKNKRTEGGVMGEPQIVDAWQFLLREYNGAEIEAEVKKRLDNPVANRVAIEPGERVAIEKIDIYTTLYLEYLLDVLGKG